jgi:hypothetical protein
MRVYEAFGDRMTEGTDTPTIAMDGLAEVIVGGTKEDELNPATAVTKRHLAYLHRLAHGDDDKEDEEARKEGEWFMERLLEPSTNMIRIPVVELDKNDRPYIVPGKTISVSEDAAQLFLDKLYLCATPAFAATVYDRIMEMAEDDLAETLDLKAA